MFRELRRKRNAISEEEAKGLLAAEGRGVLSVLGDDGYPYGVPLNFLYSEEDGKIYFHGARTGHKADAITRCDKVCFTVYGHETRKEGEWAPYVQSAVVFGRCRRIEDPARALAIVRRLAEKYYPNLELVEEEVAKSGARAQLFEIEIEHLSGKQIQEQ